MFTLNAHQQYYMYQSATDMRKGFNGLSGLIRNELGKDPLGGDVFIFVNRRRNRMKLLVWETSGFVLYYKLLESGTFQLPFLEQDTKSCSMTWNQLVLIMDGVELHSIKRRKRYHLVKAS